MERSGRAGSVDDSVALSLAGCESLDVVDAWAVSWTVPAVAGAVAVTVTTTDAAAAMLPKEHENGLTVHVPTVVVAAGEVMPVGSVPVSAAAAAVPAPLLRTVICHCIPVP